MVAGKVYCTGDATEEAFKRAAPGAGIIHIATHAMVDDENPMFSRLAFSPDPSLCVKERVDRAGLQPVTELDVFSGAEKYIKNITYDSFCAVLDNREVLCENNGGWKNLVECRNRAGWNLLEKRQYDDAYTVFERTCRIAREKLGSDHRLTIEVMMNIGTTCLRHEYFNDALDHYVKALELLKTSEDDNRLTMARLLHGIARVHIARGNHEDAALYSN